MRSDTWNSQHPPGAPYFLEFLPLIQEQGGIAGFDPSHSYERFIPPGGPSGPVSDAEAAYVRTLVDHAEQRDRIPVLTDTRTLGRVAGLKAAAPGLHAVLYRNLHQQWCSYTEQAMGGNPYFLDTIPKITQLSQHDPVIRDLLRMFPVAHRSATDVNTFYLFVFLHVYLYAHAAAPADLVIDVNRLPGDTSYRAEIEDVFRAQNIQVDFSDARSSTAYSLLDVPRRADMLEHIRIVGEAISGGLPSERGRAFATKVIADLIDECERYEFYNSGQRSVLLSAQNERDQAVADAEEMRRQAATLRDDRDRFQREKDSAAAAVEDARRAMEAIEIERDRLDRENGEARHAAEAARGEADALRIECDTATRDAALLKSEHRHLREEFAALSVTRDRLTAERDAALAARDDAECQRQRAEHRYATLAHWSMAYHDATARSLSWRLTRPLRWLGIGRPKRPPKPDLP